MNVTERLSCTWFRWVHAHNLVYNTCWEDPRLDHEALQLSRSDNVLVIASAGCNALDYALAGPNRVYAVDVNPWQTALLELKIAGIRTLEYEDFFDLFGRGRLTEWHSIYRQCLRPELSRAACSIWDRHGSMFDGSGGSRSFYFRGSAGLFAWLVNGYINRVARLRGAINELLQTKTIEEQREVFYEQRLLQALFRPLVQWCLKRDSTLALLGVPRSQRQQLDRDYPGGIAQFIQDRIEAVFTDRPLTDNYFWQVYLTGQYPAGCSPRYLQPEHFERLKAGLVDSVQPSTSTVHEFLQNYRGSISKFVLLDHMDWLYGRQPGVLRTEWQTIVDRAAPQARILWRSAGLTVDFVDPITVLRDGRRTEMGELLRYDTQLADHLHAQDRVNTYGSFHIADLHAA